MPPTLPRSIQLKLEQTLAQWPHWRCAPPLTAAPDVVAVLSPGASNFSILVTSCGQQFVVRIDGVNPAINGLNRQTEWRALQAAHDAGLLTFLHSCGDITAILDDLIEAAVAADRHPSGDSDDAGDE